MAGQQLSEQADHKTQHGDTPVEQLGTGQPLGLNLGLCGFLIPVIAGLTWSVLHQITRDVTQYYVILTNSGLDQISHEFVCMLHSAGQIQRFRTP